MSTKSIKLSPLGHTWILDLDGTIVKHNGYKIDGVDSLLPDAKRFLKQIPQNDLIIILTSRTSDYRQETIDFLSKNAIRYDHIIFNAPYGERIIVNDNKPSGLNCSVAINFERDKINIGEIIIDENL